MRFLDGQKSNLGVFILTKSIWETSVTLWTFDVAVYSYTYVCAYLRAYAFQYRHISGCGYMYVWLYIHVWLQVDNKYVYMCISGHIVLVCWVFLCEALIHFSKSKRRWSNKAVLWLKRQQLHLKTYSQAIFLCPPYEWPK